MCLVASIFHVLSSLFTSAVACKVATEPLNLTLRTIGVALGIIPTTLVPFIFAFWGRV